MASSKIKGLTIEIGGDTSKFEKSLGKAESASAKLSKELKGVNSLLKLDPSNVELLKQKQDILRESIAATEDKLKLLNDAQSQVVEQFKNGDIGIEQYRNFQREIIATKQKLETLKKEQKDFGSVTEQQLKVASEKIDEFGNKVESAGKKFSVLSGVAAAGLGYAATSASSLESAVNRVTVASGMSKESSEEFKKVLQEIHDNNFGEDYNEIAEKMSMVRQNLGDISYIDLKNITEQAYVLEDIFGMDFSETLRGVNGLVTNMGLSYNQAFDYLIVGAQNGLDKTHELADNIAEYSQLWGQAGFSAEEMFSILQNGLDSGAYNLDKVNDLVKEMGISLTDGRIADNLSSFSKETQKLFGEWKKGKASQADVIKSIISDFNNMENEQKALTLAGTVWSALGEDNALKVITSLGRVNSTYADVNGAIQDSTDQMYSGVGQEIETASRKIKTSFQKIGDVVLPVLASIMEKVERVVDKISNLRPATQKIIAVITTLVAVLGPTLIVVGKIIGVVGNVIKAVGKVATVIKNLTPIFSKLIKLLGVLKSGIAAVVGFLGWPITIILAIVAAIVVLYKKCEWFRNFVNGLFSTILNVIKNSLETIKNFFVNLYNNVVDGIKNAFNTIAQFFTNIATWVYDHLIKPIITVYLAFWTLIIDTVLNVLKTIAGVLINISTWIYDNVISPVINFFVSCFETVKNGVETAWNFIVGILSLVGTWIYDNVISPIVDFFVSCYETIKNGVETAWNFIVGILSLVGTWIYDNVISPVVDFFTSMFDSIKNVFLNVKDFFVDKFTQAADGIKGAFGSIKSFFSDTVWGGIKNVFSAAKDKMGEIGSNMWNNFKKAFKNPFGLKIAYDTNVGKIKTAVYKALGLEGWPKLSFAARGAVTRKPTPLLTGEYPGAVNNPEITTPQSIMRDTMMDALSSFNNMRYQNGSNINSGELVTLLKKYLPYIAKNANKPINIDGKRVSKILAPDVNRELGIISQKERRGY
nr:MAG TPA: Minor tail protein [Caudoviricetes sp.]